MSGIKTMELYTLTRDKDMIRGTIAYLRKSEAVRDAVVHTCAVNALIHAAEHGNPALFNELFGVLNVNDQRALANFIRRQQTEFDEHGQAKVGPDGKAVANDMAFLIVERKEWKVIPGTIGKDKNSGRFIAHAEKNLIRPSKDYPLFLRVSNDRERKAFDTVDFVKRAKALLKTVQGDDAHVDEFMTRELELFVDKVETRHNLILSGEGDEPGVRKQALAMSDMVNKIIREQPDVAEIEATPVVPSKTKAIKGQTVAPN